MISAKVTPAGGFGRWVPCPHCNGVGYTLAAGTDGNPPPVPLQLDLFPLSLFPELALEGNTSDLSQEGATH